MTANELIKLLELSKNAKGNVVFNLVELDRAFELLKDKAEEETVILNVSSYERTGVDTDDDMLVIRLETERPWGRGVGLEPRRVV